MLHILKLTMCFYVDEIFDYSLLIPKIQTKVSPILLFGWLHQWWQRYDLFLLVLRKQNNLSMNYNVHLGNNCNNDSLLADHCKSNQCLGRLLHSSELSRSGRDGTGVNYRSIDHPGYLSNRWMSWRWMLWQNCLMSFAIICFSLRTILI